jgi:hypothetical protein
VIAGEPIAQRGDHDAVILGLWRGGEAHQKYMAVGRVRRIGAQPRRERVLLPIRDGGIELNRNVTAERARQQRAQSV